MPAIVGREKVDEISGLSIGAEKTVGPARHPEERSHFSPPNIAAWSTITWITLSARANKLGEIVTPICLAVFKLITSSSFVGRTN
jgi:hypothetical protein